ncbi:plasmalemma vesicle associated protein a isoform X2 [Syngnathus scovelli]|uniref:plasmalemma vesicle associated protein a isoform X2 n=1 Tax=Syngnathus scovelli TaxID=161590 RepID=UPI0021102ADF|nr:plasmalemma vesicle associated protein a isoform X2 [Syngnathus scovelli]
MYSSGYSHVSKTSPQAQKKMQYRSKGKSCGYYLKIIFFFSSLIQSLIIVSLILFLVYGKTQDSASTTRIQDLEESFSRLSIENVALRQQRKNLTTLLNVTLTEKTRNDWDLLRLRRLSNISVMFIQDMDKKQQQTNMELLMCKNQQGVARNCPQPLRAMSTTPGCGFQIERVNAQLELVESNFTQTIRKMKMEMEEIAKARDDLDLEAIHLRREKAVHLKEIELNTLRCRQDFVQSLSGISNVSRAFLLKIESLFPAHIAFQLTCDKQREHLEQIHSNCTSLSREVEDRFQSYLNNVGSQVSEIMSENSRLKAENIRRSDDYRVCSQNRTGMIREHKETIEKLQLKHDKDYERVLLQKQRLTGDIEVLENSVNYKNKDIELLTEQLRRLNMSCMGKSGFGGLPGAGVGQLGSFGSNSNSPGFGSNKPGSTGLGSSNPSFGSTGSGLNRLGSTGAGSSSLGSTGSGLNKFGSTGSGTSSLGSSGSGLSRQGSTGLSSSSLGSTGTGLNKLGSTGVGSSGLGSTGSGINKLGSPGLGSSNPSSTGTGLNKQGSTGLGSSSLGSNGLGSSSLGSTGSGSNKLGSTGLSSTGSGLNKLGSNGLGSSTLGLNKPSSTGLGSAGLGSTGSALNKFGSTALRSSGLGSTGSGLNSQGSTSLGTLGLGSTGSMNNKPTSSLKSSSGLGSSGSSSSGFPLFGLGLGNSNTGQSRPGTGIGRGTSSGSSLGTGRTGGLGGGSVSVTQHLQDLQRIINPSYGYEERQELSRMLG